MKKVLKDDYHNLQGVIRVTATFDKQMTEEERTNYNHAITLLLGNSFELSLVQETTRKNIASFAIKQGKLTVEIDDNLSEDC